MTPAGVRPDGQPQRRDRPLRRHLLRLAPAAFVVVAVGLAVYAIYRHGADLHKAFVELGVGSLLESLAFGLLGSFFLAPLWMAIVRGLGASPPFFVSIRAFFVSQVGKYLPGSVWPVLAQMEYGRRNNISRLTMLTANVLTLTLNLAVGLVVAAALLPLASPDSLRHYWWALVALPFLLALLHPRVLPGLLNPLLRRMRRSTIDVRLSWGTVLRASAWSLASWLFFGLHLYVMAQALNGNSGHLLAAATGGFALSAAAGILFIPAPAGAGVRDAVMVATLSAVMKTSDALAITLASRVLLIVVDLLLAGAFGLARRRVKVHGTHFAAGRSGSSPIATPRNP